MATDKAINVRQLRAAEELAAAMAEMRQRLDVIQAQLDRIEAAQAEAKPATRLGEASRTVSRK